MPDDHRRVSTSLRARARLHWQACRLSRPRLRGSRRTPWSPEWPGTPKSQGPGHQTQAFARATCLLAQGQGTDLFENELRDGASSADSADKRRYRNGIPVGLVRAVCGVHAFEDEPDVGVHIPVAAALLASQQPLRVGLVFVGSDAA
eukprot:6211991-Pleurochrysis_carterae.AAC.4